MAKFRVSALERSGLTIYRRGGPEGNAYAWPRTDGKTWRTVEVVDRDEDPGERNGILHIGRKTFELLQNDSQMRVVPDGKVSDAGLEGDLKLAQAQIAELEGKLEAAGLKLEAALDEAAAVREQAEKAIGDASAEIQRLQGLLSERAARIEELEKAAATQPAPESGAGQQPDHKAKGKAGK